MEIITRLIICAVIIFIGGFSTGMLIGLYIGERKWLKEKEMPTLENILEGEIENDKNNR